MPNPNGVFLSHRPGPRAPMLHSCPIFRTSGPSPEARAASLLKRRRLGGKALFGGAAKNHRRAVTERGGFFFRQGSRRAHQIGGITWAGDVHRKQPVCDDEHLATSASSSRNQHAISTQSTPRNQNAISTQSARNPHAISTHSALFSPVAFVSDAAVRRFFCEVQYA